MGRRFEKRNWRNQSSNGVMEFKSTPLCCYVQFDQSQSVARKVLKADSTNARAHAIFAETLAATRDLPRAISEFQKAVELGPHSVEYYMPLEPSTSLPRGPPTPKPSPRRHWTTTRGRRRLTFRWPSTTRRSVLSRRKRSCGPQHLLGRLYAPTGRLDNAEEVSREPKTVRSRYS